MAFWMYFRNGTPHQAHLTRRVGNWDGKKYHEQRTGENVHRMNFRECYIGIRVSFFFFTNVLYLVATVNISRKKIIEISNWNHRGIESVFFFDRTDLNEWKKKKIHAWFTRANRIWFALFRSDTRIWSLPWRENRPRDNNPTGRSLPRMCFHVRAGKPLINLCVNWNWIESGQLYRSIAVARALQRMID